MNAELPPSTWSYNAGQQLEEAAAPMRPTASAKSILDSFTVTKKWKLDEDARACVTMVKTATLLLTSAALHEIRSDDGQSRPSIHMTFNQEEIQPLKVALNDACLALLRRHEISQRNDHHQESSAEWINCIEVTKNIGQMLLTSSALFKVPFSPTECIQSRARSHIHGNKQQSSNGTSNLSKNTQLC